MLAITLTAAVWLACFALVAYELQRPAWHWHERTRPMQYALCIQRGRHLYIVRCNDAAMDGAFDALADLVEATEKNLVAERDAAVKPTNRVSMRCDEE